MKRNRREFLGLALATGAVLNAGRGIAAPLNSGRVSSAALVFLDRFCKTGPALDNDNGFVWHTESLGISLLAAARTKNREKFLSIYAQGQLLRRPDGLYAWKAKNGKVLDKNNATDGDIYIAWALLEARRHRIDLPFNPESEAKRLLSSIGKLCVKESSHGLVLIPGVNGFTPTNGPWTINLSYWVFPALQLFNQVDPEGPWSSLIENGLELLDFAYFSDYGLPPDWLQLSDPVQPGKLHPPRFSYDAMRIGLYLKKAGYAEHRACRSIEKFFRTTRKSWIDLDTNELSRYGLDDSAKTVLSYLQGGTLIRDLPRSYFPASLAVLAQMEVSGA